MRLMIVALSFAALLFVDHYQFRGYYGSQVSQFLSRTIRSFT